jgi:hypothetical protein
MPWPPDRKIFDLRATVGAVRLIDPRGQAAEFQSADIARFQEEIEKALVHALQRFLADHNINISELTEQRTQIFNNVTYEIVATGNAGPIAVGHNGTASASSALNPTAAPSREHIQERRHEHV